MDVRTWATNWVDHSIGVIPIERFSKRPNTRLLPKGPDGWPHWEPYKTRLPSAAELQSWFLPGLVGSYGIVLTWKGLTVIDCEDKEVFEAFRSMLPPTFTVSSGRGGHLYYFLADPPGKPVKLAIRSDTGKPLAEVLSGGYVLGPGSRHPSGAFYRVIDNLPISTAGEIREIIPEAFFEPEPEQVPTQSLLSGEIPPSQPAQTVTDPWAVVNNPTAYQGASVIGKIRKLDILTLFPWKGLKATGNGWYLAICPLHDDHDPSMSINRHNGTASCLAGCTSRPLDQVNLYARLHNCSNQDAIKELSKLVD